jgi:hypothetical protein
MLMHVPWQPFPEPSLVPGIVTAPKTISALERLPTHQGAHAGRITPIPEGTRLQVCGYGFNERTLEVRWEGRQGFVFLQDIAPVETAAELL